MCCLPLPTLSSGSIGQSRQSPGIEPQNGNNFRNKTLPIIIIIIIAVAEEVLEVRTASGGQPT